MATATVDLIHDDPNEVIGHQHGSAVDTSALKSTEAVVLANHQSPSGTFGKSRNSRSGSVEVPETASVHHLIVAVDHNRVVTLRTLKMPVPILVRIRECASVGQKVLTAPPQVDVAHVHLRIPVADRSAA